MQRADSSIDRATRALKILVGLACLTVLACDNSMSFNPVAPEWPDWQASPPGTRALQIEGTLQIQQGGLLEATVLYDGLEVPGSRSLCPQPAGCAGLELDASVLSGTGHHTISFKVLRQSREVMDYWAEGRVLVSRENVNLGNVPVIPLGPRNATLTAGEAVTFDVQFIN